MNNLNLCSDSILGRWRYLKRSKDQYKFKINSINEIYSYNKKTNYLRIKRKPSPMMYRFSGHVDHHKSIQLIEK